jgi:hypothetical protein
MRNRFTFLPVLALGLFLGACSTDLPTDPAVQAPDGILMSSHGEVSVGICKSWLGDDPLPAISWEFDFTATAAPTEGTVTINPVNFVGNTACVPLGTWPDGTQVTVTEDVPDGYELELILLQFRAGGSVAAMDDAPSVTFDASTVATVYFKNNVGDTPPPPGDFAGCTPGFWRQSQHFQYWTGFDPSDLFADVFGVDYPGTLLDGVWANGGGEHALARHAVAALLNAASPEVEYPYSVAQIISSVQAAFASGDFEGVKNAFEASNELGCTVDKSNHEGEGGPPAGRGGPRR